MLRRILQLTASATLSATALLAAPITPMAQAHVGHGDEFQQQGDARQVRRNADRDGLLGVVTAKPEAGPDGLSVPSAALVDANGKPLVFVQSQTTYDPVIVVTGANQGDRVVITEGVDPTDEVVISGALSLYAESKKTQQAQPEADKSNQAIQQKNNTATRSVLPLPAMAVSAAVVLAAGGIWLIRRRKTDA